MKGKKTVKLISLLTLALMILAIMPFNAAFATDWTTILPSKEETDADFRLAVISDSHLAVTANSNYNVDKALSAFSSLGDVDALAMGGDMVVAPYVGDTIAEKYVYNGQEVNIPANLYDKLKNLFEDNGYFTLAGTQEGDVFTADTTSGKPVIYAIGNHEFAMADTDATRTAAAKELFVKETGRNINHIMNVNGYTFITSEPDGYYLDYSASEEFVMEQILAAEERDPSNKPIFYIQHRPVQDTVVGSLKAPSGGFAINSMEFKGFLNQHPRVIVLSGHHHRLEDNITSLWQDGFTAFGTGCTGGGDGLSYEGAKYAMGDNAYSASECAMFDVKLNGENSEVTIYRIELLSGRIIGEPITYTIDGTKNDTYIYNEENYTNFSVAKFNDDAKITVLDNSRTDFKLNFKTTDVTITKGDDFLQDNFVKGYKVVLTNTDSGVVKENFKIFGDFYEVPSSQCQEYTFTINTNLDMNMNHKIDIYPLTTFTYAMTAEELELCGCVPVSYSFKTSSELSEADKEMIRTHKDVNVALNKKVIAGNPNHSAATAAKLVNGSKSSSDVIHANAAGSSDGSYVASQVALPSGTLTDSATHQKNDWFIIDLGRRYNISEVKVWSRQDTYNKIFMQYFDIEASNTEDFSSYVTFGGVRSDAPDDKSTPVSVLGNGNSYRYVRLRRTGNSAYGYSEIEIFADVTAQEISRNRQSEVNVQLFNFGASYTVDGILTDNSKCWLVEGAPPLPYNLVVDMEKNYPIGFIEMFGRYGTNAETYRDDWKIYGFTDEQGKPDVNASNFSDGTLLWSVDTPYPQITNSTNPEGLKAALSGSGKYRYLVFSKVAGGIAAIGELRAEVVLPEVTGASRDSDTTIKVSFSDKMVAESLVDSVSVTTLSGDSYTPSNVTLTDATEWDGGYDAVLTFAEALPAAGMTLNVKGTAETVQGAVFAMDGTANISGKVLEVNKAYANLKENVNVAWNKPVYSGNESADGSKLTNGEFKEMLNVGSTSYPNTAPDIELPSGDTLKGATGYGSDWYIVDLGKRYQVKEIRVYPPGSNYGYVARWMTNFAVDASNDITFKEYVTLDKVGADTDAAGITGSSTPFVIEVDGKEAYRYIRLRRTGANDYGYGELEVYADIVATEVSRGASAEATFATSGYPASQSTDGIISGYNGWAITSAPGYAPNNLVIELDREYPLDMVEVFARPEFQAVYGANLKGYAYSQSAGKPALEGEPSEYSAKLFKIGSTGIADSSVKISFPMGNYKYLEISKTANEVSWISEIRALVSNPTVYSAELNDDNTLTVNFSDKMEIATLVASNFSIDGVKLSNPVIESGWDGGYSVTFTTDGAIKNGATLTISESVRNQNGIEMAEDCTIFIETGVIFTKEVNTVEANIISDTEGDAVLYVAIKNASGRLVNVYMSEKITLVKGMPATLKAENVTAGDGETITAYLWKEGTLSPIAESKSIE